MPAEFNNRKFKPILDKEGCGCRLSVVCFRFLGCHQLGDRQTENSQLLANYKKESRI